jgi:hypothetical protein
MTAANFRSPSLIKVIAKRALALIRPAPKQWAPSEIRDLTTHGSRFQERSPGTRFARTMTKEVAAQLAMTAGMRYRLQGSRQSVGGIGFAMPGAARLVRLHCRSVSAEVTRRYQTVRNFDGIDDRESDLIKELTDRGVLT